MTDPVRPISSCTSANVMPCRAGTAFLIVITYSPHHPRFLTYPIGRAAMGTDIGLDQNDRKMLLASISRHPPVSPAEQKLLNAILLPPHSQCHIGATLRSIN